MRLRLVKSLILCSSLVTTGADESFRSKWTYCLETSNIIIIIIIIWQVLIYLLCKRRGQDNCKEDKQTSCRQTIKKTIGCATSFNFDKSPYALYEPTFVSFNFDRSPYALYEATFVPFNEATLVTFNESTLVTFNEATLVPFNETTFLPFNEATDQHCHGSANNNLYKSTVSYPFKGT